MPKSPPPASEPTTVRSPATKSSDSPGWATLPKLSEPKLPPNVALKMLLSVSLSKLPPRFWAGTPVKMPEADSMLTDVSSLPAGASTDTSPVLAS